MDLERGIVRALFYDYPVDALVQQLERLNDMQHDDFLDILPQLLQWAKQEYTYTEANLLRIQTAGKLAPEDKKHRSTIHHVFDVLDDVTMRLLTIENDKPLVRFEQLFRWKETAIYVGEDLLVTSFLAHRDAGMDQKKRDIFLWDDILKHNNHILDEELSLGLTDLHAHYNATAEVFSLNWISMMNNASLCSQFDKRVQRSMELELMLPKTAYPSNVTQHCIAAIYLRFVFFKLLLDDGSSNSHADSIEANYQHKVVCILNNPDFANNFIKEIQSGIDAAKEFSLHTNKNKPWDYCLLTTNAVQDRLSKTDMRAKELKNNTNLVYQGERHLLYKFFIGYYKGDAKCLDLAPYFYLYLLLKNKVRREFIQINQLKGFENFQTYQNRKSILLYGSPIQSFYPHVVLYTSSNDIEKDLIELRVTPGNRIKNNRFYTSVFGESGPEDMSDNKSPQFVVHFIKQSKYDFPMPTSFYDIGRIKDGTRNQKYRSTIREEFRTVLQRKDKKEIVGIDAASSELFCRPETFGHVFRHALKSGLEGRTYHVGEDFLDLPDGLRAIDEAILFLQLDEKSRIGHAMALGIDVCKYYERRHYTTIITKQYLLDDCVWLYMRSKELNIHINHTYEIILLEKASQLYYEIGYLEDWDVQSYWHSMLLRGNDITQQANDQAFAAWESTAISGDERVIPALRDPKAQKLYKEYFENEQIIENGLKLLKYKWSPEIVDIVSQLQDKLRLLVSRKRISIECCPTSNLKIGFIDCYDQHPLLTKFYPIDADASYPLIKCSINTDDRGVFYTSIYEEYSLIALALYKMKDEKTGEPKYNEREILRYIGEIRKNAQLMAFRNYTDNK